MTAGRAGIIGIGLLLFGCAPSSLNIALFKYIPDANSAIERFEERFEAAHPEIDLDIELWDPYRDAVEKDGIEQICRFDVVEIDVCRLDELLSNRRFALDPMPAAIIRTAGQFIEPARTVAAGPAGKYVAPHWVCGNFLVFWSDGSQATNVNTYDGLIKVADPASGAPLLADLSGSTGLGEFYADALLDQYGQEEASSMLRQLADLPASAPAVLDTQTSEKIIALSAECSPRFRDNLEYFHDHSYVYPREFATNRRAIMIGYSERLYYTERELQLQPKKYPPCVGRHELVVTQIPFSNISRGTPSWVDGFVIPKGKLAKKRREIEAFLKFALSPEGYAAFAEPTQYLAASYLLPATAQAYGGELEKLQPCLAMFRDQLDASFPVTDAKVWRGMRRAGGELEKILKEPRPR